MSPSKYCCSNSLTWSSASATKLSFFSGVVKSFIPNEIPDSQARLKLISSRTIENLPPRKKDTKYTPISLRQEKPYAILWLIKRYPVELSSSQIAKLTGSTKNTVEAIRNGTYREAVLETKSPMDIGLCTYEQLEKSLNRSRKSKSQEDK